MKRHKYILSALAAIAVGTLACGQDDPAADAPPIAAGMALPPGHPDVAAVAPPPPEGSGTGSTGLTWTTPTRWTSVTPGSAMRRAQYAIDGPSGMAECAVFYFGPGQGGDARTNVARWVGQFKQADGGPVTDAVVEGFSNATVPITTVEATGVYDGGLVLSGPRPEPQPASMLLGAIARGPDANWFFKCTGPEATLREARTEFDGLLRSIDVGVLIPTV